MKNFSVGWEIFFVGLIMTLVVTVFQTIYHKKRINSFVFIITEEGFIIKNNVFSSRFSSLRYFFALSMFGFPLPLNASFPSIWQVIILYLVCGILAWLNYKGRIRKTVLFTKQSMSIKIGDEEYSLLDYESLEITDRRWYSDETSSNGLYLKTLQKKYKLIWGYSVDWDLNALKNLIEKEITNAKAI